MSTRIMTSSLDRLSAAPPRLAAVRAWIVYSALRVGLFAALFGLLFVLTAASCSSTAWLISGVGRGGPRRSASRTSSSEPLRERVALELVEARAGTPEAAKVKAGSDEDVEDTARASSNPPGLRRLAADRGRPQNARAAASPMP